MMAPTIYISEITDVPLLKNMSIPMIIAIKKLTNPVR
jgi:hypothetical protein